MKRIVLKSLSLLLIIGVTTGSAIAQSSKNVKVQNFSSVSVSSGIDLYLTQSNSETLTIKGESEIIKNVVVEQSGTTIKIKYKDGESWGRLFKNESIKVYLTYKTLAALTASGGSDVYSQNTIKTAALTLVASGGSDVKISIASKNLTVIVSGGSDLDLSGSGENMQVTASGGSDVDAFNYSVDYAKVTVSGGSDANILVNRALEASASGGSDINYKGNASLKKTSSSKSGDVNHVSR